MTVYQVGKPHDLKDDDPWFGDIHDAIEEASHQDRRCNGKELIAIWDNNQRYEYLFFGGEQFRIC